MDRLFMHDLRKEVDERFVGFKPNGASIKPVHIAGGAFRSILGYTDTAQGIKILSYVCDSKGETPRNTKDAVTGKNRKMTLDEALDFVIKHLEGTSVPTRGSAVDLSAVTRDDISSLRYTLQKLVNVDSGVYGVGDSMLSYTAGAANFVVKKSLYEDAGDLVGYLIKIYCPELGEYISQILKDTNDPISMAFAPVLGDGETEQYEFPYTEDKPLDRIAAFTNADALSPKLKEFLQALSDSGKCLKANLEKHTNKLPQLRLFNLYCGIQVIRYLSLLEAFYCDGNIRPMLLDFSKQSNSSIARTSVLCYSQLHKAISRFYAWAYAQELKDVKGCNKEELLASDVPYFDRPNQRNENIPKQLDGLKSVWDMAKEEAKDLPEVEAMLVFGAAINDMTALEATGHPVNYMRKLGTEIGLLYPPTNLHVDKRFVITDDVIEVILRACVLPGETLASADLCNRLWERFGIIVGGSDGDIEKLNQVGSIVYADADALNENWNTFAETLQSMNFAEQLPDGILQIGFGGAGK
jgi:hypothetical protein